MSKYFTLTAVLLAWLPSMATATAHVRREIQFPDLPGYRTLKCDEIRLTRTGEAGPAELVLPQRTTNLVKIPTKTPDQPLELAYTAVNYRIAPEQGLPVTLRIPAKADAGP